MALVAKPVSAAAPQNAAAIRPANLARAGVASSLGGAVDSVAHAGSALVENGAFSVVVGQGNREFAGQSSYSFSQRHDQGNPLPNPGTGIVDLTSQGFVELIELRDTLTSNGSDGNRAVEAGARTGRLIRQAVALYEASIEIAAGHVDLRGETISITL